MLFCKPGRKRGIVFEQFRARPRIYFRCPELKRDVPFFQSWKTIPAELLQNSLNDPDRHPFVAINSPKRICLIELYRGQMHELGKRMEVRPHDCCIQILINPLFEPANEVFENVLRSFLHYYFSYPQTQHLYAVPEIHEHRNCRVLEQSGFHFQRNMALSSRAVSLYLVTRKQFLLKEK